VTLSYLLVSAASLGIVLLAGAWAIAALARRAS
jgi:hypothetical protein